MPAERKLGLGEGTAVKGLRSVPGTMWKPAILCASDPSFGKTGSKAVQPGSEHPTVRPWVGCGAGRTAQLTDCSVRSSV